MVFVHTSALHTVLEACRVVNIPSERIVLLDEALDGVSLQTLGQIVHYGSSQPRSFSEPSLAPGAGRTRLAVLRL